MRPALPGELYEIFALTGVLYENLALGPHNRALYGINIYRQIPQQTYSRAQTPPSHKEKGRVTIERFLGCAESTVLILDKPMK